MLAYVDKALLSASLMCLDPFRAKEQLSCLASGGIDYFHMDIMDGHFVKNITLGFDFCNAVHALCPNVRQDYHLMVERSDDFIPDFLSQVKSPSSIICFHPETALQPIRIMKKIREAGCGAGLAVSPAMPLSDVKVTLPYASQIILMMYEPGFAGQPRLEGMLDKISELTAYKKEKGLSFTIEIDGSVSAQDITPMRERGAQAFVLGTSGLFGRKDLGAQLSIMKKEANR